MTHRSKRGNLSDLVLDSSSEGITPLGWQKVLWRDQAYPDNYVDSKFLESLVVNADVSKRRYWKVVGGALLVGEQVCLVSLLGCVAYGLHQGTLHSEVVLWRQGYAFFVGMLLHSFVRYRLKRESKRIMDVVKSLMRLWTGILVRTGVLAGLACALSPIYATLTASISPDTTIACIFGLLTVHMYLHEYAKSLYPEMKATLRGSLGLVCGLCASVLMATRMQDLVDVIAIMLLSLQIYILVPYAQHDIYTTVGYGHVPSFLITAWLTMSLASKQCPGIMPWLICALALIIFFCPMWLVRIQKFKANINGPWDEAVPKLNEEIDETWHRTLSASLSAG